MRICSELGHGTTLCMYFPRFFGEAGPGEPDALGEPLAAGSGQVKMLIDDESTLRTVVAEVLSESGHQVIQADDGASGPKLLQSTRRIDLLVTDVALPGGMNGRQRPPRPPLAGADQAVRRECARQQGGCAVATVTPHVI